MRARVLVLLCVSALLLLGAIAQEGSTISGETYTFQAEVTRMMDILINALYSKREVFLRELISNAADACDKYRYLALREGRDPGSLSIRIKADKDNKILTITDTGIGMSREELINNLGTIAQSGTKKFLEQLEQKDTKDLRLIGQFGVGFYSAFVVADTVTVTTRREEGQQYVWQSQAAASYTVAEDTDGEPMEHGTRVTLHLKEDALEYTEPHRIRELVQRYSAFIDYPIELWTSTEREVPVESEIEPATEDEEEAPAEPLADEEQEQEEESEPEDEKAKTRRETVWDWELLNKQKPLWARPKDEITDEEYQAFYKALSKDYEDASVWEHFKAEGAHEFTALIYAPSVPPYNQFENAGKTTTVKLYVRRVLVNDVFEDMLPRYLSFIHGVVDSDDLSINVSREMLQEDKALAAIKKKLVRKALEMLKGLADREDKTAYNKFFEGFGKNLKLGVIEDSANRPRLAKLLRFYSSKSNGEYISLDDYVARMKEGQKAIYYVAGESKEAVERSPFLERLVARDYEVLYLIDPIDEYAIQNVPEYDDHKLVSVMKEGLKLEDDDDAEKEKEKEAAEALAPLIDFLKETLSGKVEKVVVSTRLQSSPCVLVTAQYGWSANMERIVRAQALGDANRNSFMSSRKTLEINPSHPIITELNARVQAEDASAAETARLLYDTALLTSGFNLEDTAAFAQRMYKLLGERASSSGSGPTSASVKDEL